MASPPCTPMKVAIDGSTRPSSIATRPSTSAPRAGTARAVVRQAGDAELGDAGHEVVRELRAGPVVVDDRLDLAGHEGAHAAEQLAVLLLEQQLEAEEVGERGVLEAEVVEVRSWGVSSSAGSSGTLSMTGASSSASVRIAEVAAVVDVQPGAGISRACIRGLADRDDRVVVAAHHQRRLPDQPQERQAAPAGHRGQLVVVAALGPGPGGARAAGRRRPRGWCACCRRRSRRRSGRRTPGRGGAAA